MKHLSLLIVVAAGCLVLASPMADAGQADGLVTVKKADAVITVGGSNADIAGYTSRAIQIAVDALHSRGGGTVHLNSGEYRITGPVRLADNIALIGSGNTTVLKKCDGFKTRFIVDADYGMQKVTVEDPSGFEIGMGIELYDDKHPTNWDVTTAVITDIEGHTLYMDNRTVHDYIATQNGTISNGISIVEAVNAKNVRIADLMIDGNGDNNDYMNGCRGGGVYVHKSKDCTVENVHVTHYNGDSFSLQITERITVRGCEASYGTGLGIHPGTGSDSPVVENCFSHHNGQDGIFLCWRVQHGVFRNNRSYANGRYGISIGHQDTDNVFTNNQVCENKQHGVYFRTETEQNSGHRNTFRDNTIENNGTADFQAYGFYITGPTRDIVIEHNTVRSTGKGNQAGAVFVQSGTPSPRFDGNTVSGHPAVVKQ